MQKTISRCIVIVVLFLAAIAVGANFILSSYDEEPQVATTVQAKLYTLSEYDGRIALYKDGFSMPIEIYDVYLSTLPEAEQSAIAVGITASTDEEIQRLIEDYTS